MPAVTPIEKSALAAEVPDPGCLEMKDVLSCMDTLPASAPNLALPDSARCSLCTLHTQVSLSLGDQRSWAATRLSWFSDFCSVEKKSRLSPTASTSPE